MASSSGRGPGLPPTIIDGRPTAPDWMSGTGLGQLQVLSLYANDTNKKLCPFIVGKSMKDLVGEIESTTTEANGNKYILRIRSQSQADKLLKMTSLFDGTKITVESHPVLNKRKCVIFCPEIKDVENDKLLIELANEKVIEIRRISRKQDGVSVNTPTLILTISGTVVPDYIKVGPLRVRTRTYIPEPMLCFKCYDYGHTQKGCKKEAKCRNCSGTHVLEPECTKDPFCKNCQGQHSPSNRSCPVYKTEKEITKVRFLKGVPYSVAAEQVRAGGGSYAEVSKVQGRLEVAKVSPSVAELLKTKDDTIKLLQEKLANIEKELAKFNNEEQARKDRKKCRKQKKIQIVDDDESYSEMDTDSNTPQATVHNDKTAQVSAPISNTIAPKIKRQGTTEMSPPAIKKISAGPGPSNSSNKTIHTNSPTSIVQTPKHNIQSNKQPKQLAQPLASK